MKEFHFSSEDSTLSNSISLVCVIFNQAGWSGDYINVRRCGGSSIVFLQLKDPSELLVFVKRREFLPDSGISISSR